MKEVALGEQFEPTIRWYGGVEMDNDEEEALKLQPNFSLYEEIDEMEFMATTEKAFNALRWHENLRNSIETSSSKEQGARRK